MAGLILHGILPSSAEPELRGYVAAGKAFGMSQSGARSVVLRYDEYAQEILKEGGGK